FADTTAGLMPGRQTVSYSGHDIDFEADSWLRRWKWFTLPYFQNSNHSAQGERSKDRHIPRPDGNSSCPHPLQWGSCTGSSNGAAHGARCRDFHQDQEVLDFTARRDTVRFDRRPEYIR